MATIKDFMPWLTDKGKQATGYSTAQPVSQPASQPAQQPAGQPAPQPAGQTAPQFDWQQYSQQQQAAAEAQRQAQAAAAAEAQRQALIKAQRDAAEQIMLQGEEAAKKQLSASNVSQQATDKKISSTQTTKPISIGGGLDITPLSSAEQAGAAPAMMASQVNLGTGGTQQRLNQFKSPSARGLSFGGS